MNLDKKDIAITHTLTGLSQLVSWNELRELRKGPHRKDFTIHNINDEDMLHIINTHFNPAQFEWDKVWAFIDNQQQQEN